MSAAPAVWTPGSAAMPAAGSAAAAAPSSEAGPAVCGPPGPAPGSPGGGAGSGSLRAGSGATAGIAVAPLGLACAAGSATEPEVWPSLPQGGAEVEAGVEGQAPPRPSARLTAAAPAAPAVASVGLAAVGREGSSAPMAFGEEVPAARASALASGATPLGGVARSLSPPASSEGVGAQETVAAGPGGRATTGCGSLPALCAGATTHQSSCGPPGAASGSSSPDAVA